jgi:hypothetical protein
MSIPQLTAFINQVRAASPDYDWKPKVVEQAPPERIVKKCAAPVWIDDDPISLTEARDGIRGALQRYMDEPAPGFMLLLRPLPGTGKTQAAVELIDELIAAGHRVAYAGPRHAFFADVVAKAADSSQWYEWLPRQDEDIEKGKIETCRFTQQINTWMVRGYDAIDFCSGVCGWDYLKECPFHKQKSRTEPVIFIQHQHVTLGHPMEFTVLVGDESPLQAFMHEWEIPAKWVMPPGMDMTEPLTEIINRLAQIVGTTDRPISGRMLYTGLGGPESVVKALEGFEIPLDAVADVTIHSAEDASRSPYFHLPALGALMLRECKAILEHGDCIHRVIATPGQLRLLLRRKVNEKLPNHVIWLDATGDHEIYEQIFGRKVRIYDARPEMHGKIYQVTDRANGKGAIRPGEAAIKAEERRTKKPKPEGWEPQNAKQAKQLIKRIIESYGYAKPAVISFKGIEFPDIDTGHFYASRGTNAHEEADAVFVLGTPQPSIFEVAKMAKMIYFSRDEPLDTTWYTKDLAYQYKAPDGFGRCYPVSGFWNDAQLNRVLSVYREDEIVQAAHRGRPVNHVTDIWLLTNIPIMSLPPDELLTMREIMDAPKGVNIWKWQIIQDMIDVGRPFGVAELVEAGLSRNTASEYIEKCEPPEGWRRGFLPGRGGRPPKGIIPG